MFSPTDFQLATVVFDGTQIGGVDLNNADTGETLLRLVGTNAQQAPPGTYRLEFDNFTSPEIIVEPDGEHVYSPSDFGLVTVSKVTDTRGALEFFVDGELAFQLFGSSKENIPPGVYTLVFAGTEVGEVTLTPNEVRVFQFE